MSKKNITKQPLHYHSTPMSDNPSNSPEQGREGETIEKAFNYATWLLNQKFRSIGEIKAKLKEKQYSPEVSKDVIQRLVKAKYLDDPRLIEQLIAYYIKYKYYGFFMIKQKLSLRLFKAEDISVGLELLEIEDETKIAKQLLIKQERIKGKRFNREKELIALQRKGFRGDVIRILQNND